MTTIGGSPLRAKGLGFIAALEILGSAVTRDLPLSFSSTRS